MQSAAWVYSLAAHLDKPLAASTAGQLRSLMRACAGARARCSPEDEHLPVLHLLISLGGYFGQDEDTVMLLQEHYV